MPTMVEHDGYLRKVLGANERVLFVVRTHFLFYLLHNFLWLALMAVLIVAVGGLWMGNPDKPGIFFAFALLVVPIVPMWWSYQQWNNLKSVVTNRRVLQMRGVLSKQVVDASLDQINDVKTDQSLFGRMLNYGDVEVVTASAILTDEMQRIARPLEFKRALIDAKEALMHPHLAAGEAPAPQ
jgi:uncharacterized membrane protein YdbT with pleckstrin-like domain